MSFNALESQTLLFNQNNNAASSGHTDAMHKEYYDPKANSAAILTANFKTLDKDGSGGLSKQELTDAFNDKNAAPGVHDASKMLLDNFDSASHMSGHKKAFFLDFSEQAYLTDSLYKPNKLQNEIAPSDLRIIVGAVSKAGAAEFQSGFDEHRGVKDKLIGAAALDATTLPVAALATNSFLADPATIAAASTVATTCAVASAAAFAGAAVYGGAIAVGAYNDYRRSQVRPFYNVVDNELEAGRKMLATWTNG